MQRGITHRQARRRLRHSAGVSALLGCAALLAACAPEASPAPPAAPTAGAAQVSTAVPISAAAPVEWNGAIGRPHEPPETPRGATAYMLDVAVHAIYVFDYGRGRMLGPAVRIIDPKGTVRTLPGYPFVFGGGEAIPQDECAGPHVIAVAEGLSGTIAVIPILPDGTLGVARHLALPSVKVHVNPHFGGGEAMNHGITGPQVTSSHMVCFPDGKVVAISLDQEFGTSVAYATDAAATRVVEAKQLPGSTNTVAALAGRDRFAVAASDGILGLLSEDLRTLATTSFSGEPTSLAFRPGTITLRTFTPDKLLQFADDTLATRETTSLSLGYGSVTPRTDGSNGYMLGSSLQGLFGLSDDHGVVTRVVPVCKGLLTLATDNHFTVAICRGVPAQMAVIDMTTGERQVSYGGEDPLAIVAST